jgi:hypothetical protein
VLRLDPHLFSACVSCLSSRQHNTRRSCQQSTKANESRLISSDSAPSATLFHYNDAIRQGVFLCITSFIQSHWKTLGGDEMRFDAYFRNVESIVCA